MCARAFYTKGNAGVSPAIGIETCGACSNIPVQQISTACPIQLRQANGSRKNDLLAE
jgi:hypothetical protein